VHEGAARLQGRSKKWWPVALIAAAIIVLDQVTKVVVDLALEPGEAWLRDSPVRIVHVRNTGSAFGLFPNQTLFLTVASFIAIVFMVWYYRQAQRPALPVVISFGLLLGGAIGNLLDRVRHSFVVDFIDFRVWPVFNAADASISIALILLLTHMLLTQRGEKLAALKAQAEAEERARAQGEPEEALQPEEIPKSKPPAGLPFERM
jgi:signal peptidase II